MIELTYHLIGTKPGQEDKKLGTIEISISDESALKSTLQVAVENLLKDYKGNCLREDMILRKISMTVDGKIIS